MPEMWKGIRRGPGFVTVEHGEGATLLRYQSFPYFGDPIYEELYTACARSCASARRWSPRSPSIE
ncbi:MAG: hypothetical protein R3B82_26760 [Sandaracinaceae bacterium]